MKLNIQKNKYESNNYFELRKKFIQITNPKTNKDLIYYDNLSKIFINMIFLKCRYNKKTEKNINNIVKKMKNNKITKLLPLDYNSLKIDELKKLLKNKKLSSHGKKIDLIQRLRFS